MKKVIKIFIISLIIFISCNAVSQNEKIDATTKKQLDSYIESTLKLTTMTTNSFAIDGFMDDIGTIETLLYYMPEKRKYITLDDVQYIADYFVTNYYVKGAKSVDEAKQHLLDKYKENGIELYESIDEIDYNAFIIYAKILKMPEDELKNLGDKLKD